MNALGIRQVGIGVQPTLQFSIGRAVGGGVQVALHLQMTQQEAVIQLRDGAIRLVPVSSFLEHEDLAVALHITCGEDPRQALAVQTRYARQGRRFGLAVAERRRRLPGADTAVERYSHQKSAKKDKTP